jgi:glycosyltransferase involved in cell wall biosynthesis
MEPIRILHIISSLNIGGTEKQCVEIVKRINGSRYKAYLVTFNKDGPLHDELIETGVPWKEFKISDRFYHPKSLLQILRLASFMRKERFRLVQTYGFYSTIPGIIAAKIARVPAVIAGKRDMNEFLTKPKIKAEKILWRFCDKIVVNANKIRDYLISEEGVPEDKIEVIYNGVDLKKYIQYSEMNYHFKEPIVGMIANFRKQKDHNTFLKAATIVLKKKKYVSFLLLGSGRFENEMMKYARSLGILDSVIFCGRKTGKELYAVLRRFTISVLSSTNEGMPNAILESMAFGIPVIANPSGGVPELVEDGVTGYLFPYKRPDILAEKIIYLLNNKKIVVEMGKNGRRKVEQKFNYSLICRRYEELYDKLQKKRAVVL